MPTSYFCMGAPGSSREPETPWELPGEGSELPGAPKTGVWETPGALELPGDPSGDPLSGLELPGDPLSRGLLGVSWELQGVSGGGSPGRGVGAPPDTPELPGRPPRSPGAPGKSREKAGIVA